MHVTSSRLLIFHLNTCINHVVPPLHSNAIVPARGLQLAQAHLFMINLLAAFCLHLLHGRRCACACGRNVHAPVLAACYKCKDICPQHDHHALLVSQVQAVKGILHISASHTRCLLANLLHCYGESPDGRDRSHALLILHHMRLKAFWFHQAGNLQLQLPSPLRSLFARCGGSIALTAAAAAAAAACTNSSMYIEKDKKQGAWGHPLHRTRLVEPTTNCHQADAGTTNRAGHRKLEK
eukprot:354352-Chlamydomonas_euryale.AAC.3